MNIWKTKAEFKKEKNNKLELINNIKIKWENQLCYIQDEFIKGQCAIIFDNQWWADLDTNSDFLPIVKQIFAGNGKDENHILLFDIISVQPLLSKTDNIWYRKWSVCPELKLVNDTIQETNHLYSKITMKEVSEKITAKSGMLKTSFSSNLNFKDLDVIDLIVTETRSQIIREVLSDLKNNAGTRDIYDFKSAHCSLEEKIYYLTNVISKKTLRKGSFWVAGSLENVANLIEDKKFNPDMPRLCPEIFNGRLNGSVQKVIVDNLFPYNKILIGMKESNFDPGYIYSPYIGCYPIKGYDKMPEEFQVFSPRYFISYNKRLISGGANFYAILDLQNPIK